MSEIESQGEILIYATDDGHVKLDVKLENETLWMSQQMMAELFQTTIPNINIHIKNIFEDGELDIDSVIKDFLTTAADGKNYKIKFYNLDMIISVGYRVKSVIATKFRIWATQRLREYIIKGFTMDDERLKNPPVGKSRIPDYFDEMLERIRDIRASERRMYLQIRDIIALAADYEPSFKETTLMFSKLQNKLHYAVTGKTASELIMERADASQPNMNLMTWQKENVRKSDVIVVKNYLREDEISELNRIVVMCLDYAEDQARRRKQIFLKDWEGKINQFLEFNERTVLVNAGGVSHEEAKRHAEAQYDIFNAQQREQKLEQAETNYLKQLETSVNALPEKAKKKDKGYKHGE